MQYLVNEIVDRPTGPGVEAKVFKTVEKAFQFIRKNNKSDRIMIEGQDASLEQLTSLLKERLATVTLVLEKEPGRRIVITAFEYT